MLEKKKFIPIESRQILIAYDILRNNGLVSFEYTQDSVHKSESLTSSINGSFFDVEKYELPEEKVVAYMYHIIKDHVFPDGNKRTGVLVFEVAASINALPIIYKGASLDEIAVFIEKTKEEHTLIIRQLARLLFALK